jgi:protein pelota
MWDSIHLDRIELACDPSRSADLAAIIMQVSLTRQVLWI